MSCRKSKDAMLYFYDELTDDARLVLEAHLLVCAFCRQELGSLQHMRKASPKPSVDDAVLQPTRRALFYKLRHSQPNQMQPRSAWMQVGKLAFQAGFAALLVYFGFWLGENKQPATAKPAISINDLFTASNTVAVQGGAISPYLLGINTITLNAVDGTVEIAYNTVNDVTIHGDADDPAVQLMLRNALQMDEEPAMRQRAVKALQHMAESQQSLDESYVQALGQVLMQENNLGIKLSALNALQFVLDSPQARQLLVQSMLTDKNEAIRIQAFKSLMNSDNSFADLESILSTTQSDSNAYIRTKSLQYIKQGKETRL